MHTLLTAWAILIRYHVVMTFLVYGTWAESVWTLVAFWKEWAVIAILLAGIWKGRTRLLHIFQKRVWINVWIGWWLLFLIYAGIDTVTRWSGLELIIPWIKYDILPVVYMLLAILFGVSLSPQASIYALNQLKEYLPKVLLIIVVWWALWQFFKRAAPEAFLQFGYWPVGDFAVGEAPPLWYRTWPWGLPRFQGLLAWPNNLGYLLATVLPVLVGMIWLKWKSIKKYWIVILWGLIALIATLSRWAILGSAVGIGVVVLYVCIKGSFSKTMRNTLVWAWLVLVWAVFALFVLKPGSTLEHWTALQETLSLIAQSPLWYWIWASWPSVHHAGVYLPENQFLQLFMDLGWFWWGVYTLFVWWGLVSTLYMFWRSWNKSGIALLAWLIALSSIGLFLHSYEDSMVWLIAVVPLLVGVWSQLEIPST